MPLLPNLSCLSLAHAPLATGVLSWEDLPDDVLRQAVLSFETVRDMCGAVDALLRAGRATHHIFEWKKIADQYAMPVPRPADDAALNVWRKYVMDWCKKVKPMSSSKRKAILDPLSASNQPGYIWVLNRTGGVYNREATLRLSIRDDRIHNVRRMLDAGADVDSPAIDGQTALMIAIEHGNSDIVDILLEAEANVDAVDENGGTALMLASGRGRVDIVARLLAPRASVNARNKLGFTALMVASVEEREPVVRMLLNAPGIDVNAADAEGRTALIWASLYGNAPIVRALLAAGAQVNAGDIHNRTALIWASHEGHTDVVALLRNAGAREWLHHPP